MSTQEPITVSIRYFAILKDQRGASTEVYSTRAQSLLELYQELAAKHKFTLPSERLRVSVNANFVDWATAPRESDAIVFIPPVAGG